MYTDEWFGIYKWYGNDSIAIRHVVHENDYCGEESARLEMRYLIALEYVRHYELNGNDLRIYFMGPDGAGTMNFTSSTASVPLSLPSESSTLTITPNPVGDAATITLSTEQSERAGITIYDLRGMPVRAVQEATPSRGLRSVMVPTSGLAGGEYSLVVHGANGGVLAVGRLVVVR